MAGCVQLPCQAAAGESTVTHREPIPSFNWPAHSTPDRTTQMCQARLELHENGGSIQEVSSIPKQELLRKEKAGKAMHPRNYLVIVLMVWLFK